MKNRGYQKKQVIADLLKKNVKYILGVIEIPKNADVGIKTLGKIDFLQPIRIVRVV